jgi:putative FmdB family regulatory protein
MPLYDYECSTCGTVKEVQHSVSEIGNIEILCDDCSTQMKKMLSLPALIGFDSVGRSRSRKEKEGSSKSVSPKSESSKSESPKKESASKSTPKNDSQA